MAANLALATASSLRAKAANSAAMLPRRLEVMARSSGQAMTLARSIAHPMRSHAAESIVLRIVPPNVSYLPNYSALFQLPPDRDGSTGGTATGAYSVNNRFTGALATAAPGLNGSYWGTPMGVAAEDAFYSKLFEDVSGTGPSRLMPADGRIMVQRAHAALNQWEDREMPKQLLFSGNSNANIIVARTIRSQLCLNLDLGDPVVQAHLLKIQPAFQPLLDALSFSTIAQAIEDPSCREFARQFVFGACEGTHAEAIWARTVRLEEGRGLNGFNQDAAQNLIMLGKANETLSTRLVGVGVVTIRANATSGLEVNAARIHGNTSPYHDGQVRDLVPVRPLTGSGS